MIVYAAEKADNLYEKLQDNKIVASVAPITAADKLPEATRKLFDESINKHLFGAFASENIETFDLHRLYTILVTVGWNLNDDVFGVKEVWGARHTPEDKPFNLEHNPRHVIGHITGCVVVDDSYTVVSDDISVDELPDKFHILTSAVVYKHIKSRDEKLADETKELIESIARGEWFVSMEALFSDFDYALTKASGERFVVARNDETAFLTKHLRVHGGVGQYQGNKIGRYLKNITFSGKGLVKKPGNPESYVFNDVTMFKGAFASLSEVIPEEHNRIIYRHLTKYSVE
jgi:hypothetical protein